MRILTLAVIATLTGCAPLTGAAATYEVSRYEQLVNEGKAPPLSLVRSCNQDGLVRDATGRWEQNVELTRACFAKSGWEHSPQGWKRQ